jgi:NADPH:quinone reductase-like Zn-dependent oxidoreductase
VTATVRDEECRPRVAALVAQAIEPAGFADFGPFDVILELVGAINLTGNLEALATGGRIVVIGVGAGAVSDLDLRMLMHKRAVLRGSTLRSRPIEEKALAARMVEKMVLPGFASGDLAVPVAAEFPLDEAPAAYDRFRAGSKLGKVVLKI